MSLGPRTGALWTLWGGHAGPSSPLTPAPTAKQDCRPQPLLSLLLLWTPCALPGPPQGSQSKNLLAFFVLISESPSAPCCSSLPFTFQPWGLRTGRARAVVG